LLTDSELELLSDSELLVLWLVLMLWLVETDCESLTLNELLFDRLREFEVLLDTLTDSDVDTL
jgi:hypothetical protein